MPMKQEINNYTKDNVIFFRYDPWFSGYPQYLNK